MFAGDLIDTNTAPYFETMHYGTRRHAQTEVQHITKLVINHPDHQPGVCPQVSFSAYLWFKALHLTFMVTWFAGLFYLPRLFIYHAEAEDEPGRQRFTVMERRLFAIMTIGAVLTLICGLVLLWLNPGLLGQTWFEVKVLLLLGLGVFHFRCWLWIEQLKRGYSSQNTVGLRWFNEVPVLFLLVIIGLAILKPF
jgi:putative membrane protein